MVKRSRPVDVYVRVSRKGSREHFTAPERERDIARHAGTSELLHLKQRLVQCLAFSLWK